MKSESIALLVELLDRGFDNISWHGPNLTSALRGVDAKMAAKQLPGRKSIWQQCLHSAYWKQRVLNKLTGMQPFPRPGSNWPRVPHKNSEAAWKADVELLHEIHRRFRRAVSKLDSEKLRNRKLRMMIMGSAMHDVYHAGQVKLLRRMITRK